MTTRLARRPVPSQFFGTLAPHACPRTDQPLCRGAWCQCIRGLLELRVANDTMILSNRYLSGSRNLDFQIRMRINRSNWNELNAPAMMRCRRHHLSRRREALVIEVKPALHQSMCRPGQACLVKPVATTPLLQA